MAEPAYDDADNPRDDPERVTYRSVPCNVSLQEITAGYNGNVGSYFYVIRWTGKPTAGSSIVAGDVELAGGYPFGRITDIADVVCDITGYVDLESPDLIPVLHELLADKSIDASSQHYAENPAGNKLLPTIIGKVLDRDFTPVVAPRAATVPPAPQEPAETAAPRRSRFWKSS